MNQYQAHKKPHKKQFWINTCLYLLEFSTIIIFNRVRYQVSRMRGHLYGGLWQIARQVQSNRIESNGMEWKRIEFDLTTASAHKTTIADHFLIKSLNLITTCFRGEWSARMPTTWVVSLVWLEREFKAQRKGCE